MASDYKDDIKPFWNDNCKKLSEQCWLPEYKEKWIEVETKSCFSIEKQKLYNNIKNDKPWFSTKKQEISDAKEPAFVELKKEDIITRKIRLYPTCEQREKLREWLNTRRFVYNKAVGFVESKKNPYKLFCAEMKEKYEEKELSEIWKKMKENGKAEKYVDMAKAEKINMGKLKNKYVTKVNIPENEKWQLNTPARIRNIAIDDLEKAYKTAFSQLRNNQIKYFSMKFCSKKRDTPSMGLQKESATIKDGKLKIFPRSLGEMKYSRKQKGFKVNCNPRIQFKHNKWFLILPIKAKRRKYMNQDTPCSLDPGVKTFQTAYTGNGVYKFNIDKRKITKLHEKLDLFKSLRDRKIIKRKSFKRRERKIYYRLNNLINHFHWKTCDFLTKNYKLILIPNFESQKISQKIKSKKVNRYLFQLRHYQFRERLKYKCEQRGCKFVLCSEEFTSQTCTRCGKRNTELGCARIFTCDNCKLVIDRDVNGARNILIKYLKEYGEQK